MEKRTLIVIESGSDASGKATQTQKIYERILNEGKNVKKLEFPNYKSDGSALVKMYLKGDFGTDAKSVDPYIASTFYAVDRYASYKMEWEEFYNTPGTICLCDRYVTSNIVHQASKMPYNERETYLKWLEDLEYNIYKIPRPDCVIFLDVPVDISFELMKDRRNKITNEDEKDIHEKDYDFLRQSYENSLEMAKKLHWNIVKCTENDKLRTIEDIHEEIYNIVKKHL